MPVSVALINVEFDPHGADLVKNAPLATVHLVVSGSDIPDIPFLFKIQGFANLDDAVIRAQNNLLQFAQELQAAAQKPLM